MNRSELDAMRRRIAERSAAENRDSPWILGFAGIVFFMLLVISQFI